MSFDESAVSATQEPDRPRRRRAVSHRVLILGAEQQATQDADRQNGISTRSVLSELQPGRLVAFSISDRGCVDAPVEAN